MARKGRREGLLIVTRSHRERKLGTRVDDRDSSLIAPDDTVSSGVKPQSGSSPSSTPSNLPRTREPSCSKREKRGHVSCSSIRKSTPGYLGSGPKYTAHVRGSFFRDHDPVTWIRANFIAPLLPLKRFALQG